MVSRGSYCLCIMVNKRIVVRVGALGEIAFKPGRFIYVGSALNGLYARIKRHINTSRGRYNAIHWHIDHLLRQPETSIERVYLKESPTKNECKIAGEIAKRGTPIKRFGCSDCRCMSHLYRVEGFDFLVKIGLEEKKISEFT